MTSEQGKGSCFTIHQPVEVIGSKKVTLEIEEELSGTIAEGGSVLVIDDDATVRDLVKRSLSKEGLQVMTAANGEEGLRLAKEHRPDVVTLDVQMPGMGGWDVLKALKADPALREIAVIMMTNTDEKNTGFKARRRRVYDEADRPRSPRRRPQEISGQRIDASRAPRRG